jgi:hypothetical protein
LRAWPSRIVVEKSSDLVRNRSPCVEDYGRLCEFWPARMCGCVPKNFVKDGRFVDNFTVLAGSGNGRRRSG